MLKTPILERSIEHAGKLFGSSNSEGSFRQMIEQLPEYAADVLHEMYKAKDSLVPGPAAKRYQCPATALGECTGTVVLDSLVHCETCGKEWKSLNTVGFVSYWASRAT